MKNQISHILQIATVFLVAIFSGFLSDAKTPPAPKIIHGKTQLPSFVRVLSFDELMRLPRAKRVVYIRGLRSMMREIENLSPKLRASANDDIAHSQMARLLKLYDATEEAAWAKSTFDDGGLPQLVHGKVKCGGGEEAVEVTADRSGKSKPLSDTNFYVCGRRSPRGQVHCTPDQMPVMQQLDGSFTCASLKSFNHLDKFVAGNARHVVLTSPRTPEQKEAAKNFTDGYKKEADYKGLQIDVGQPQSLPATAPALKPSEKLEVLSPARLAAARAAAEAVRGGVPAKAGAVPPATAPDSGDQNVVVVQPAKHAPIADGPQDAPKESTVSDEPTVDQAKEDDPPAALAKCEPDRETPKTCNADEIEAARTKYATDPYPDCIYAGGISTYIDGKKRAYRCQAPTKFCFAATNCENEGEKLQPDYACKANQIICNPLVFGLQSDGKTPFCVSRGAHATAECDSQASDADDAKSPLDQNHPGLREAWNDFADRLYKLCHANQTAATLHCAECDIITRRLFAMNVAARDVKNCGAAIKYEKENCAGDGSCSQRPGAPKKPDAKKASDSAS